MTDFIQTFIDSPIGTLQLVSTPDALCAVYFENHRHAAPPVARVTDPTHAVLRESARQLREYFLGTRTTFTIPLAPVGTPFQHAVWNVLRTLSFGERTSYAQIARDVGRPNAIRAVGNANARNPLSIIVPCHRVVASSGELTGYAGGLERKRWLLRHEGRGERSARQPLALVAG